MTIDRRVVEMRFDNGQFERGVRTTMSTLNSMKKALDGLSKTISAKTTGTVDFNPMSRGIDHISGKFSSLGVVAASVLNNITTDIYNAGKAMAKSFTTDLVVDGFKEYELKMNSVQTIMNSTGESLEAVMGQLNRMNNYADRTIYSFSDMTSNIGKFTNAGIKLEDAVDALMGVTNLAALAGVGAQEASNAIRQIGQAVGSGYVDLVDWGSIETANLNTKQFKELLIQTAEEMGTLVRVGDKWVSTTTDLTGKTSDAFNATEGFRASIRSQWMTSEVLTKTLQAYTDETTELGKKAYAAAQDVKTFTQLIATMKESIGSGWAESFELIFGDFEEAKAIFTEVNNAISSVIDSTTDWRNNTLRSWKAFGGRNELIDAFRNLGATALTVFNTITTSFAKAFGILDSTSAGRKLEQLTSAFRNITREIFDFVDGNESLVKISNGVASGLHIIFTALSALGKALVGILKYFAPVINAVLDFVAGVADFVVMLDDAITRTGAFKNVVDALGGVISPVAEGVKKLVSNLMALGKGLATLGSGTVTKDTILAPFLEGLEKSRKNGENTLKKLNDFISGVKKSLSDFADTKLKFLNIFGKDKKSESGGGFLDGILSKLPKIDFSGFNKNGDQAAAILERLKSGFQAFWKALEEVNPNRIVELINSIIFALTVRASKGGSDLLKPIEALFGTLKSLADDTGGILKAITGVLDGTRDCLKAWQSQLRAKTLLTLAGAIAILAISLTTLSNVPIEQLTVGLVGIGALFGELIAAMFALGKTMSPISFFGAAKIAVLFTGLATAVGVLAVSVAALGQLDWMEIAKGLTAVGGSLALLISSGALASKFMSARLIGIAAGLTILATALGVIAVSVAGLGSMNFEKVVNGLKAMLGILAELSAFMLGASFTKFGPAAASGILILSAALGVIAITVAGLAQLKMEEIGKGLAGIAGGLVAVMGFVRLMPPDAKLLALGGGMMAIAEGIRGISKTTVILSQLSLEELAKGLGAIAATLGILIAAIRLMPKGSILDTTALVILSAGVNELAKALYIFGEIPLENMIVGLAGMAGSMGILAVSMKAFNASLTGAVSILAVSAAMNMLAAALTVLSKIPLMGFVTAIGGLAGVFAVLGVSAAVLAPLTPVILGLSAAVAALGLAVLATGTGILNLSLGLANLAVTGRAGALGFVDSVQVMLNAFPLFIGQLRTAIDSIAILVSSVAPRVTKAIGDVLIQIGKQLIRVGVTLTPPLLKGLLEMLHAVNSRMYEFTEVGIQIITNMLRGISDNMDGLVTAATDIIVTFINSLAKNLDRIIDAGFNLMDSFINGVGNAFEKHFPGLLSTTVNAFIKMVSAIAKGIWDNIPKVVDAGVDMVNQLINSVKSALGFGPSGESGIFKSIGDNIIRGVINGVMGGIPNAISAIKTLGGGLTSALQGKLKIQSPSKVMRDEVGVYIVQGIAEGIKKDTSAEEAARIKAQNITSAFKTEFDKFDLSDTKEDIKWQITDALYGSTEDAITYGKRKVDYLTKKLESQSERVKLAEGEYKETMKHMGETSKEAQEAYNKLLQQQLELVNITNELNAIPDEVRQKQEEERKSQEEFVNQQKQAVAAQRENTEKNRKAMNDYIKYISENKENLLRMGFTMQEIEASAKEMTGYDPTWTAKQMSKNAADATSVAMSAVATEYETKSVKTFGNLTNGFSEWGGTYATAVGTGFTSAFGNAKTAVDQRLTDLELDLKTRTQRFADDLSKIMDTVNYPTITPVIDMNNAEVVGNTKKLIKVPGTVNVSGSGGSTTVDLAGKTSGATKTIIKVQPEALGESPVQEVTNNYTFNQTNNSPKVLNRTDIYRQTQNQFSQLKNAASSGIRNSGSGLRNSK